MAYTPIDKPSDYFNTVLYTGNATDNHTITGVNFQPDWVWVKGRSEVSSHRLNDVVRGAGKELLTNTTDAEYTYSPNTSLKSFDSDGFTLGTDNGINKSSVTYTSWNWLAGGTAVSNTQGSITSSVSANTTSGFSIVSWTGNGSNGATIGHGLGVTPAIVITKRRSAVGDWLVGGSLIDTVRGGANSLLLLNTTAAMDSNSEVYQTFSSTTFQVGVNAYANTSGSTMISYCFAEVKGFSKFGSYTGNGSTDGTFVYTGFKPAFAILKGTNDTNWRMFDNKRLGYNPDNNALYPNGSDAEDTQDLIQFFSNGFKLTTTTTQLNGSGTSYIYMAFAENPLVGTNNIPATAR